MANLHRKQEAADRMFASLVAMMDDAKRVKVEPYSGPEEEVPAWL